MASNNNGGKLTREEQAFDQAEELMKTFSGLIKTVDKPYVQRAIQECYLIEAGPSIPILDVAITETTDQYVLRVHGIKYFSLRALAKTFLSDNTRHQMMCQVEDSDIQLLDEKLYLIIFINKLEFRSLAPRGKGNLETRFQRKVR